MLTARIAVLVAAAVALPASRAGAQVLLELGTPAPSGSAWHEILKEMGRAPFYDELVAAREECRASKAAASR